MCKNFNVYSSMFVVASFKTLHMDTLETCSTRKKKKVLYTDDLETKNVKLITKSIANINNEWFSD